MENKEPVHVDSELYVNEATLELLRRRIESEVKAGFFRSIGLPIGGAGVVAILLLLFVWIPDKIATIIEKHPTIQENIESSAIAYFNDADRGQKFLQEQIERIAPKHIEQTAQKHVETTTASFFKEKGEQLIEDLGDKHLQSQEVEDLLIRSIHKHLQSQDVKDLLAESVNRALQPKIARLSEEIRVNMGKLVMEIKEPFRDVQRFEKESLGKLYRFLRSPKVTELQSKQVPIALTFMIRRGKLYGEYAVREYLTELKRKFAEQFQYVLILNNDGKFLGLFPPKLVVDRDLERFMSLLNSDPTLSPERAKHELERMFTKRSTVFIQSNWSVIHALTKPVWPSHRRVDEEVAVVDLQGRFVGTTSRRQMITGILS